MGQSLPGAFEPSDLASARAQSVSDAFVEPRVGEGFGRTVVDPVRANIGRAKSAQLREIRGGSSVRRTGSFGRCSSDAAGGRADRLAPRGAAAGSSPDALGLVRNLPSGVAGAALHPPVVPARDILDLKKDSEHGGIGRGDEIALRQVAG